MTCRIIDPYSGSLIEEFMPDFDNDLCEIVTYINFDTHVNVYYFYDGEKVRYIEKYDALPSSTRSFDLNKQGIRITEADTVVRENDDFQKYFDIMPTSDGLLRVHGERNADGEIYFDYYSNDYELQNRIIADTFTSSPQIRMMGVGEDRVLIKSYINESMETGIPLFEVALYDREGHLIKSASLAETSHKYQETFAPIMWEHSSDIYLMATLTETVPAPNVVGADFKFSSDILKANNNGSFDVVKRITWENAKRGFLPREIMPLEDGSFLIYSREFNTRILEGALLIYDWNSIVISYLKMSPSDLGLATSVSEEQTAKITLSIGPNPASEHLQISLSEPSGGTYQIHDMTGRLVQSSAFFNTSYLELNLQNVMAGTYVLSMLNEDGLAIAAEPFVVVR